MVSIGKKVAQFSLPATGDKSVSLKDYKRKNLVIYFNTNDSTPGCTLEGQNFIDIYEYNKKAGKENQC